MKGLGSLSPFAFAFAWTIPEIIRGTAMTRLPRSLSGFPVFQMLRLSETIAAAQPSPPR
ncbi:exported hypothetical protein [Thiomonas sp. CB2]|uniref:Uncharacterized protein n=1 Tax=Thiomonas delicata TaxID=364030 RepID=A0A238D9R0_THIDL|nr:exported hypothetical protein [Thiomonas sp. CB2]CQR42450.1 exported hypothetical protein [Thiomonas sp. CB3]SBP90068.1 exported hypothetical protein [Thiomonas delicata]VDY06776.1 protein of unknown function [Thiomonas sp. Bio17B3]VDY09927.1 protein of unknown function [Thiomonas sp. Sup16B3]VDY15051.1 conserved protein of unknown function [Thiomonas sp. OC7]